jgi:hypothetical protein
MGCENGGRIMTLELSKGDLFMSIGDETISLGDGIQFTKEIELSADENPPRLYHLNNTSSINFEVSGVDLALLNDFCSVSQFNEKFTIEHQMPIMVQARWHKNPRIRKKWLKRFGMKSDTVKVRMDATAGEYNADDGSFDFETDKREYIWRPDQKRRGLKIEM